MNFSKIGIITYHHFHLKTEQVMQRLLLKYEDLRMYALPFRERKTRKVLYQHRPDQNGAIRADILAQKHGIAYMKCESDSDIDDSCDVYLILGAGILSPECVSRKKIVNCHPGIIPASRGLDSFKWAIYDDTPLGITLHYIDKEVDAGEIISVIPTNVYISDDIYTLARRHYENEIDCMTRFEEYMDNPENKYLDINEGEARMRMPFDKEKELSNKIPLYAEKYGR